MCETDNIISLERIIIAAIDLTTALQKPNHDLLMLPPRDNEDNLLALQKLEEIFCRQTKTYWKYYLRG